MLFILCDLLDFSRWKSDNFTIGGVGVTTISAGFLPGIELKKGLSQGYIPGLLIRPDWVETEQGKSNCRSFALLRMTALG